MLFPARLSLNGHYLTAREAEILWLCLQGLTSPAIAEKLSVSPKTVERHKENIRTRFGLYGYHALMQFAQEYREELEKWVE